MEGIIRLVESTSMDIYNRGWGNGYVVIHKSHPLFGKHYDDVDVSVHGGLTFSRNAAEFYGRISDNPLPEPRDWWVFGFDTAHWQDNLDDWPKQAVLAETLNLWNQLEIIQYKQRRTK